MYVLLAWRTKDALSDDPLMAGVVFVERTAPGDLVDVLVLRRKKGFMEGVPQQFHFLSEDRMDAFCQHFGICGGCKWQHITYEAQCQHKEQVVRDALQRIGKIDIGEFIPILPSEKTTYYRNKLEFAFSNRRWLTREEIDSGVTNLEDVLGFHRGGAFDKIVDIKHCYLQQGKSNEVRLTLKAIALEQSLSFYDARLKEGFLRQFVIRNTTLGESMIIMSFYRDNKSKIEKYLSEIRKRLPFLTTIFYNVNPKDNDYTLDLDYVLYDGPGYIEEMLGNVKFRIGPKSFFQTNSLQAKRLFDVVADFAGLSGKENVYDLYTGIGSIALYLASKCKQMVGIEEIEMAIEDAKINSALNKFTNTVFYAGDVKNILTKEFAREHGRPDVLITDPPRAGMHKNVVKMLLELESPKIVYVSCNPSTQARDLHLLQEKYEVSKVRPVDMFPHTHHIETVALLTLKTKEKALDKVIDWLS